VVGANGAWIQLDTVNTASVTLARDLTVPIDTTPDGTDIIAWSELPAWRPPGL